MTPQAERLVRTYRRPSLDHDGDTIMVDSDTSPPSPSKDKFNFDWFDLRSDDSSPIKPQASASPVSACASVRAQPFPKSARDKLLAGQSSQAFRVIYPPPPSKPLTWVWQCHMCRSRYPLSVTRRCLIDGHYYCSGDSTNQRNAKRRRKAQSCTSEFDYVGWEEWGQWMRKNIALRALEDGTKKNPSLQGCHGCSFPSQCRYENRPPIETLDLQKFVKDSDLIWEDSELSDNEFQDAIGSLAHVSFYSSALNKTFGKETQSNKLKKDRKGHNMKLDTRSTDNDTSQARRQRFYSSFSDLGRLSSPESSPTSETLTSSTTNISTDRGKFDPTLPSVAQPSDGIVTKTLTLAPSSVKYALQPQSSSFPAAQQVKKYRTNSKPNDPAFNTTTTTSPLLSPPITSNPDPSSNPLTRITSRQNLPSFLRTFVEPSYASVSASSPSPSPAATAVSPIPQGPDFEDVTLSSPVSPEGQSVRRISTGTHTSSIAFSQERSFDQWKQKQQRNQVGGGSSGSNGAVAGAATGDRMSFLFPSFGFGGSSGGGTGGGGGRK